MEKSTRQRLHDLKTVHTNFKTVMMLLQTGYPLDDEAAKPVLAQLQKAVEMLKEEIGMLEGEWNKERH